MKSKIIWMVFVFNVVRCQNGFREVYLTKNKDIKIPEKNQTSSIFVSGCSLECIGEKCHLSDISTQNSLCETLVRMYGNKIYFYQEALDIVEATTAAHTSECLLGHFGSTRNGMAHSDEDLYRTYGPVTGVKMWVGSYLEGIQFQYGCQQWGPRRGEFKTGRAGTEVKLNCEAEERITAIDGKWGAIIDCLSFSTSEGKTYGPYGRSGEQSDTQLSAIQLIYPVIYLFTTSSQTVGSIDFVFSCYK